MKKIRPWVAFMFCVFISYMAMFSGTNAMPAFYAFLPMCFFFTAMHITSLQKKLDDLEIKIQEMA